jgi:ABC-2 type transport system permease protein
MTAAPAAAARKEPFHPERPLPHYVWKLLRLQIVLTISTFRAARLRRKIGTIVLALVILAFAAGVFAVSWLMLGFLNSPELAQILAEQNQPSLAPFLESMPALILAGAFLGILVTSFGVLLSALYLSGDMDFLLSSPVPVRAVFITKQLQAILPNFGFIALFGLPVLFGLGAAGGYNFLYYPLVVIVLAMLALAAAGLSSLLVMGVVRIFPARRVAEVLGAIGALLSILCSQSGNFVNAMRLDEQSVNPNQIPFATVSRFNSVWNPLTWAGRGLVDLGEARFLTALLFLGVTLALTGGLYLLSLQTAERLYYTGWASMQTGVRKKRTAPAKIAAAAKPAKQARTAAASSFLAEFLPRPVLGMVRKDFTALRRDPRNLTQLVTPIILGAMYVFILFRSGNIPAEGQEEAPEWLMQLIQTAMIYGNVGISLLVGWSFISRLGLMGFSQEGKNYWMLKSAPVGAAALMAGKFLVAYIPGLAVGWLFMLIISLVRGAPLSILLFGWAVVALAIVGAAGVNVAFGVTGVNLKWEDPRRMTSGWSGCFSVLASFLYMGIAAVLFFGPPILVSGLGLPAVAGQAIGLLLGGAFSFVCGAAALALVRKRVEHIGED